MEAVGFQQRAGAFTGLAVENKLHAHDVGVFQIGASVVPFFLRGGGFDGL